MKRVSLAICDSNRLYCERLGEYLRNNLKLSFDITSFTDTQKLLEYLKNDEVSLLIISEKEFDNISQRTEVTNNVEAGDANEYHLMMRRIKNTIIVCNDEGQNRSSDENISYVSRLLPASEIVRQVIRICTESPEDFEGLSPKKSGKRCRVLGLYTPIPGCGQSLMSMNLGEVLSEEGRSILISFECFSPLSVLFDEEGSEDLMDLFYHAECNPESFSLHLERMKITKNGLDLIKPAMTPMQIREIDPGKVKELIRLLIEEAGYENVVLDITTLPEGFPDILAMCDVIYTIEGQGSADQRRISLYNQTILQSGYEQILEKTVKMSPPERGGREALKRSARELVKKGLEVTGLGA